jgi:hypothetical protein
MLAEKQQQFRADIKANSKPWESKVELTMPGELKLYRDYELTDTSEVASAAGKKGGKKTARTSRPRANCITCKMVPRQGQSDKCNQCQLAVFSGWWGF